MIRKLWKAVRVDSHIFRKRASDHRFDCVILLYSAILLVFWIFNYRRSFLFFPSSNSLAFALRLTAMAC